MSHQIVPLTPELGDPINVSLVITNKPSPLGAAPSGPVEITYFLTTTTNEPDSYMEMLTIRYESIVDIPAQGARTNQVMIPTTAISKPGRYYLFADFFPDTVGNEDYDFKDNTVFWAIDVLPVSRRIIASLNPSDGGFISLQNEGKFTPGQAFAVHGTPNWGYVFLNWSENGKIVSTNETYEFYPIEARDLVANFGRPALSCSRQGDQLVLSWPVNCPFKLQCSTNIGSNSDWKDYFHPDAPTSSFWNVTHPLSGATLFFRLCSDF